MPYLFRLGMDSVTSQVNEPFVTLIAVPVKEVKELWRIQR